MVPRAIADGLTAGKSMGREVDVSVLYWQNQVTFLLVSVEYEDMGFLQVSCSPNFDILQNPKLD